MKIMLSAGEASGDLHGANLAEALKAVDPQVELIGMGGEQMRKAGVRIVYDIKNLGVIGIGEIIKKIPFFYKLRTFLVNTMKEEKPDALVCIDYPGFNMKLIEKAKEAGIPVIYYILPTIWAWHKSRGNVIAEYTDLAVSLFPFEAEMYKKMGTNVVYGGHPLLDTVKPSMSKDEAYSFFGLQQEKKTVLFMPGSRVQEVQSLYGKMLAAGKLLQDKVEGLQFMVPKASTIDRHMLEEAAREANLEVHIGEERVYDMMNIADAAICASGTATLETALMGVPTLLVYRVNALTYWLSKILVHLDSIGLPNIISGHRIMPELWQDEVTPENIEAAVLPWLVDAAAAEEARHLMAGVRCQMGEAGAVRRTAEIISEFVKEKQLHEAVQ
jgi:lipid-A-disaccharide synthase